jgi:hypothetical protein
MTTRLLNVQVLRGARAGRRYGLVAPLAGAAPAAGAHAGGNLPPGIHPTPEHNLVYRGGKTIAGLTYTNFYVGGNASWTSQDREAIDGALAAAMTNQPLNKIMGQYFPGKAIETIVKPSRVLDGRRPRLVTQASVEATVRRLFKAGTLNDFPIETTVFNFMLPSGTILRDDAANVQRASVQRPAPEDHDDGIPFEEDASSLNGLGGYHGSVHIANAQGRRTVYYAVGVYSERLSDGTENGIVAFDQPWKNIVATFYHELNEARTDPDVEDVIKGIVGEDALGWTSQQGEECGDFPVFEAEPTLSRVFRELPLVPGKPPVPIQLQYSNKDNGPALPVLT